MIIIAVLRNGRVQTISGRIPAQQTYALSTRFLFRPENARRARRSRRLPSVCARFCNIIFVSCTCCHCFLLFKTTPNSLFPQSTTTRIPVVCWIVFLSSLLNDDTRNRSFDVSQPFYCLPFSRLFLFAIPTPHFWLSLVMYAPTYSLNFPSGCQYHKSETFWSLFHSDTERNFHTLAFRNVFQEQSRNYTFIF